MAATAKGRAQKNGSSHKTTAMPTPTTAKKAPGAKKWQAIKLTELELEIMQAFWTGGAISIRQAMESVNEARGRGGKVSQYTTVQTVVYRLLDKGALKQGRKIGNAHIFEAEIDAHRAQRQKITEMLVFFNGSIEELRAAVADY